MEASIRYLRLMTFDQEPLLEEYSVAAHVSSSIRFTTLGLIVNAFIDLQVPSKLFG